MTAVTMTSTRRTVIAGLASIALLASPMGEPANVRAAGGALPSASGTHHLGTLKPGKEIFEPGAHVDEAAIAWEACPVLRGCFEYTVEIPPGSTALRALLDVSDNTDSWAFGLRSPDGTFPAQYDPTSDPGDLNLNRWTLELEARDPAPGRWRILVAPVSVTDSSFRLSVRSDGPPRDDAVALPNLRAFPPLELGFVAPVRQTRFPDPIPNATPQPKLEAGEQHPASCTVEETATEGVTRCLRLSLGVLNVGDGPLDLRFNRHQLTEEGEMRQQVRGEPDSRPAGRFVFHPTHFHFHSLDTVVADVLRVERTGDGDPQLDAVRRGRKHGFCLINTLIADIVKNRADRQAEHNDSACAAVEADPADPVAQRQGRMVLSRGWVDVYPWYLPGQYVDFAGLGDGEYVVRATVDASNRLVETDETDNTSFAHIQVAGDRVTLLARGFGPSPWDPDAKAIPANEWLL